MADQISVPKRLDTKEAVLDLRPVSSAPELPEAGTEKIASPELPGRPETVSEARDRRVANGQEGNVAPPPGSIMSVSRDRAALEQRNKQIEAILSEGLENLYLAMNADNQTKFKQAGEQASHSIAELMDKGTCTLKKVVEIIRGWLTLIPGVNRFFLEQEAKIRADKIISIQKRDYG
jgi:hypothetical protein